MHSRENQQMKGQNGFTLIEILVTAFILTVGILGLAAMQSRGLQESNNTYFRTQANILARDIADRMRANRLGTLGNDYVFSGGTAPAAGACATSGSDCSESDMANYDLNEWFTEVQKLPGGNATVTTPAGNYHVITVMWDEARDGGTTCADMECLSLYVEI